MRYYLGFAIAGAVVSVYTVVFYGGISGLREILIDQTRLGEELVNSNTLAMFLSISSCIFLLLFLERKRWLYLLPVLLTVAIIALTGSKKGIIDIGLGFLFTILLGQSKSKTPKFITWMIRLVFFGLVVYFCWQLPIFNTIRLRLEMMFATIFESSASNTTDYSTLQRQALIQIGMEQFFKTPVLGVGIDASGFLGKLAINSATYLHNNYVELLATGGIVGFLMYYVPFIKIFISNWKTYKYSMCSRISIVVLLLQFINDSAAVQYASKLTYVVAALAFAACYECCVTQKDISRS
ncbi:MAG: O-antigen ligase family protein [Tyzzerella sp.]|nr:O-antigen ligase family protein [Tyzzerella sp.]